MNILNLKLLDIISECNKHIKRIIWAYEKIKLFLPKNKKEFEELSEDNITYIDQFLFRFSKLQDAMGEKLFKLILLTTGENVKNKTFIDILNRLEELNLINKDKWLYLRNLRNSTNHEYSGEIEEIIIDLKDLLDNTKFLYNYFCNIKKFIFNNIVKYDEIDLNKYAIDTLEFPKE